MRQEIIFYDYEFNLLGRTVNATDIYHKELYNGIGTFEAGLTLDDPMARLAAEENYIVAVWEGRQAIITSAQAIDSDGAVRIYGRTPNWLLAKRACPNFGHRTGTPYALAHTLVDEVWGDSIAVGVGRDIAANETTFWRNVYNPLNEVVADCLDRADGGHRVVFDTVNRQWRFETFEGRRTGFLFSADRQNIYETGLKRSVLDYFNGGFYVKDDENETWIEIPSEKEGIYRWTTRLDGSGESSARSDLEKRKIEEELEFTVFSSSEGYELGDIVRTERRFGGSRKTAEMRVWAIERWASPDDCGERPLMKTI